jgi:zinc transport system ATP-binding protein
MSLVDIRGLSVAYGGATVLHDVDFRIEPGEIVTIVGPNGSGKSTLLRAIIGAVAPRQGTIREKPGLRIGYVPQRLHIDPTLPMTVRRFLSLPLRVSDAEAESALARAGVGHLGPRQMADLSGGQFQRVLLARALLSRPELLILDEATQGLDQPGSAAFYRQIEAVRRELGCAVIMVSHELHVVMAASDRVVCLNGHVCCQGEPEHVASAPEYRALFGTGTKGALALYRHEHSHDHFHDHPNAHLHAHGHDHDLAHDHAHDHEHGHGRTG